MDRLDKSDNKSSFRSKVSAVSVLTNQSSSDRSTIDSTPMSQIDTHKINNGDQMELWLVGICNEGKTHTQDNY